jgi:precorrin-6Y C5,15-methyltransferase (decarboxylating)
MQIGDFYVLAIDCAADEGAPLLAAIPGLPDSAFANDGQLTKREVRTSTLAKLAPTPGALLWDVGAGCGSIGIEWMRAARDARALCFEHNKTRVGMIVENRQSLGVPGLEIVEGQAPLSFADRPSPDAVFLGGDVANDALFEACWQALKPQGRFVANAVTPDGDAALYQRQGRFGGELVRIDIAVLDAIGFVPRRPVTQWAVTRGAAE